MKHVKAAANSSHLENPKTWRRFPASAQRLSSRCHFVPPHVEKVTPVAAALKPPPLFGHLRRARIVNNLKKLQSDTREIPEFTLRFEMGRLPPHFEEFRPLSQKPKQRKVVRSTWSEFVRAAQLRELVGKLSFLRLIAQPGAAF